MKILDVQGYFSYKNNFVPKELALCDGKRISHYIFKPPSKYCNLTNESKKQVQWLESFYHGLTWSTGWIPVKSFGDILQRETKNNSIIYVKGVEKTEFIRKYLGSIVKEYPKLTPSLHKTYQEPCCFYHKISYGRCALANVKLLYKNLFV